MLFAPDLCAASMASRPKAPDPSITTSCKPHSAVDDQAERTGLCAASHTQRSITRLPLGFAFPQVVLGLFLLARKHLQASEGLNVRQRSVSHRQLLACIVCLNSYLEYILVKLPPFGGSLLWSIRILSVSIQIPLSFRFQKDVIYIS
jgi:hypothetical protein